MAPAVLNLLSTVRGDGSGERVLGPESTATGADGSTERHDKMAKSKDWLKQTESDALDQCDQFTLKIVGAYATKFGLIAAQTTAARNDYLWWRYATTCALQFEQEVRNRVMWRDHLRDGPKTVTAGPVPAVGSEFAAPAVPAVPDGVVPRWRELVAYIKNHPAYVKADGLDLGIEPVAAPAQSMKPTAKCRAENGSNIRVTLRKDGHEAYIAWCRRGTEPVASKLGTYTRATFIDSRPNLVAGQPEVREYTFQYVDADVAVGEISDVCRVTTLGWQAVA